MLKVTYYGVKATHLTLMTKNSVKNTGENYQVVLSLLIKEIYHGNFYL